MLSEPVMKLVCPGFAGKANKLNTQGIDICTHVYIQHVHTYKYLYVSSHFDMVYINGYCWGNVLFTASTFRLLSKQQCRSVPGDQSLSIILNPESALLLFHPLCNTTQEGWLF